jgi:hypothetical protein
MLRSRLTVGAVALAGLALAGFAAVALGKWLLYPQDTVAVVAADLPELLPLPQLEAKELKGPGHVEPPRMLEAALARLHNEAVTKFISSPGFGMSRMPVWPQKVIKEWTIPWWSPGELDKETPIAGKKDLELIHQASLKDFSTGKLDVPLINAGPDLFRIPTEQEKKAVAAGGKEKTWEIKSLDLVGLVKHKEPVVYVSEKLPDMKDLKDTPTRPADLFEFTAIEALQKGDNLFVRGKDNTIRMLGAIRAAKQCLSCHDANAEGDLLGAFSYTMRVAEYKLGQGFRGLPGKAAQFLEKVAPAKTPELP